MPVLLVLAVLAVHLHLDAIAADLSARSRAALRAAEFSTVEVAFNGREAMVRGHVADALHMVAVEGIIEGQRGVRWADLRGVTVGGAPSPATTAPAAPSTTAPVSPPTAASPTTDPPPTPRLDAGVARDAGRADAGQPIADADLPDAPQGQPAMIALTWSAEGPVLAGTLPSAEAQAHVVKAVEQIVGDIEWQDHTVVQADSTPEWLPGLLALLPDLSGVDGLTLHVDPHLISIGGAALNDAARGRIEAQLDAACPKHVVQNQLTIMSPSAQVAARMHAVRGMDLFFGPDGVNLTEDGAAELAEVAAILKGAAGAVRIESHTDNVGKDDTNQARSDARAAVVRDALQGQGVPSARLHAVGRGARAPIADNATQDGRALNRRIVITLDP